MVRRRGRPGTPRIPDTTSLLASYEVQVDRNGELMEYRRVRRYRVAPPTSDPGFPDDWKDAHACHLLRRGSGVPPRAGTLYDVLELILDRGMVIDVFVRVSLVGIEILKIDARIVVASVDTYLRFAEACNRLDLERDSGSTPFPS